MVSMLEAWCQVKNLTLENGLIQNNAPMSLEKSREVVCFALRWRTRQCKTCNNQFDILNQGFLYSCGDCSPVSNLK